MNQNSDVLDIGAWIGPTALIALVNGAQNVTMIEPNPSTVEVLEHSMQLDGVLNHNWNILPYCLSDQLETVTFGMPDGNIRSSSAASVRGTGAWVNTITIERLIQTVSMKNISLIKIDIEGSEQEIIPELHSFSSYNAAIWLSLHPPFISDLGVLVENVSELYEYFHVFDADLTLLDLSRIEYMILFLENDNPPWGTSFGNFFEIALLPKSYFDTNGDRITPRTTS